MRLKYIFALPIVAATLWSCDDIEESTARPIENPQLGSITQNDFVVTPSSTLEGTIDLESLLQEAGGDEGAGSYMIDLFSVEYTNVETPLPEDATVSAGMVVSQTSDLSKGVEVSGIRSIEGGFATSLSNLISARNDLVGEMPDLTTFYYGVEVYVTVNGGQYRIGDSPDYYFCNDFTFDETGIEPGYKIDSSYSLVLGNTSVEFVHAEGTNQYQNPVFTVVTKVSDATTWTIKGNSGTVYGVASGTPADAMSGTLVENGLASTLTTGGNYEWTINMKDMTFSIIEAIEALWTPGNGNDWGFNTGKLTTTDYMNFSGFTVLSDAFKLTGQDSFGSLEWGAGPTAGTLAPQGNDIEVSESGVCWVTVSLPNLSYTISEVKTMGVIGGFPDNEWADDYVVLTNGTELPGTLIYTGEITFPAGNVKWKFRANGEWDINLGGTYDDLQFDGPNLDSPGEGTYTVTLDLSKVPYTVTFASK